MPEPDLFIVKGKENEKVAEIDQITQSILDKIDDSGFGKEGAYNLRYNGYSLCHGNTKNVTIKRKADSKGMEVYISGDTKGEQVHIPVVVAASGVTDEVYNDFFIEDGADVTIIAGCGIHNSGCNDSRHDGIHTFHVGKGANVRYEEKHYGEGEGTGARILNPKTKIILEEKAVFTLDSVQIEGVDSTKRETEIIMGADSKLFVMEKLMTHDEQVAISDMEVVMDGEGSSAQIISRTVAKGKSVQRFHPKAIGCAPCHAHIQCDSIIMDNAQVCSIPEIDAKHIDAAIIHEAAIGRINNEQLIKLNTFGLDDEAAEAVIIENFLN